MYPVFYEGGITVSSDYNQSEECFLKTLQEYMAWVEICRPRLKS